MTLMLASVTSPAEAEAVWAGGADIIDLKNPAKGALGALDARSRRDIVRSVGKRKPVSAAAGSPHGSPEASSMPSPRWRPPASITSRLASPRMKRAPIASAPWPLAGKKTRLVGVLFADRAPDFDLLQLMASRALPARCSIPPRKAPAAFSITWTSPHSMDFVDRCRAHGLMSGPRRFARSARRAAPAAASSRIISDFAAPVPRPRARGRDRPCIRADDPRSHSAAGG